MVVLPLVPEPALYTNMELGVDGFPSNYYVQPGKNRRQREHRGLSTDDLQCGGLPFHQPKAKNYIEHSHLYLFIEPPAYSKTVHLRKQQLVNFRIKVPPDSR